MNADRADHVIAAIVSHKGTENTKDRHRQPRTLIVAWRNGVFAATEY
jgi:hypothetical protein